MCIHPQCRCNDRAPGSTACLWSFTRPCQGQTFPNPMAMPALQMDFRPLPPLPFGSQSPSRVPGGPLSLFGAGGAGKCLLPAPPLPSHPPRVLCQEARGEPFLRQDQAGPPGCFWKQPPPAGLFSVPSGRPAVCVPSAVRRVSPRGVCRCRPPSVLASTRGPVSAALTRPGTWFSRTRLLVFLPLEAANLRAL